MTYTELQVTSNFSFLSGASHPDEMVQEAAELGYSKIAICDRYTGNSSGAEPTKTGSGPDGTYCRYSTSDITYA